MTGTMNPLATMTPAEYDHIKQHLQGERLWNNTDEAAANTRAASLLQGHRDDPLDCNQDVNGDPIPVPLPAYFH